MYGNRFSHPRKIFDTTACSWQDSLCLRVTAGQNTPKKGRVDEKDVVELDASNNESGKYKVEAIWDSAV